MRADGDPGGLLVLSDAPSKQDEEAGRPAIGQVGQYLRGLVAQHWDGPVAFDNAIRCYPGAGAAPADAAEACRGYTAQTLKEVCPTRVLLLGSEAAKVMLGRSMSYPTSRGAYAWLHSPLTPVFWMVDPQRALTNRFIRATFEEDIRWALTCNPVQDAPPPPWDSVVQVVMSAADDERAVDALRASLVAGSRWLTFDTETAGQMFNRGHRIVCIAVVAEGTDEAYVWGREALQAGYTKHLFEMMRSKRIRKVAQNGKFDGVATRSAWDLVVGALQGDTRLWRRMLEAEAAANLDDMSEIVGMGGMKDEAAELVQRANDRVRAIGNAGNKKRDTRQAALFEVKEHLSVELEADKAMLGPDLVEQIRTCHRLGALQPRKYSYGLLPREPLYRYCARDTTGTDRLAQKLVRDMAAVPELQTIWDKVIVHGARALEQVEAWGIAVDREAIASLSSFLGAKLIDMRPRFVHYGKDFNPSSDKMVAELLFNKLLLHQGKMTKGGARPSVDEEALSALRGKHPIVEDILEYRRLAKLKGTYADGLYVHIREDGRVHSTYNLDGARSGRLSSDEPNLQNIPKVDDRNPNAEGNMVKACFVAADACCLLQLDYSQIEYRMAAMLSGDQVMIEAFSNGLDIHQRTAELISQLAWGIPPAQVTGMHRNYAKSVNFGLLYGMADPTLAERLGCPIDQAKRIRAAVLGAFKQLAKWILAMGEETRRTGFAWTVWDGMRARRRQLFDIAERGSDKRASAHRNKAQNGAVNSPVQGSANEFCLSSLVRIVECIWHEGMPAKLVGTVHDSLLLEVPIKHLDEVAWQAARIMVDYQTTCPLAVDREVGKSWGRLRKVKLGMEASSGLSI